MRIRDNILLLSLVLGAFPALALAQTTPTATTTATQRGIFDCNRNGAGAMVGGIGAIAAGAGVYVPVSDNVVQLNTGMLVYKECVLRPLVVKMREQAMAQLAKTSVNAIQTGRDGNARYVVNQGAEELTISDAAAKASIDSSTRYINPAFRTEVARATAINYRRDTRDKESALVCDFPGDLNVAIKDPTRSFSLEWLREFRNPACNPLGAYYTQENVTGGDTARALEYQRNEWAWGNGYYAGTDGATNPLARRVRTPAITVQQSFQRIIDSPVYQLESASDIGQMTNALYAGMTTQIISDREGLAGLTQSFGGQPSYINRVANETSRATRNAAVNIALEALGSARKVEGEYLQAVGVIAKTLTQTSSQLRSLENQCWNLIIPKVCTGTLSDSNECTGAGGTYVVATSSERFAESLIAVSITPLASPANTKLTASQNALQVIDQLIQRVSSASLEAQRSAIEQLNTITQQGVIHNYQDIIGPTGIIKERDSVLATTNTLVKNTLESWANDPSASIGWCNINNAEVITRWKNKWKKV